MIDFMNLMISMNSMILMIDDFEEFYDFNENGKHSIA